MVFGVVDVVDWSALDGVEVRRELDGEFASGHPHRHGRLAPVELDCDRRTGAGAGAACQSVARPALENLSADGVAIHGRNELNIRAVREPLLAFDNWSQPASLFFGNTLRTGDYAMWIPDGDGAILQFFAVDHKMLADDFTPWTDNRDDRAVEGKASHLCADCVFRIIDAASDGPAEGGQCKVLVESDYSFVIKVSAEDSHAVAALFSFGTIWIQDAEGAFGIQNPKSLEKSSFR